jgi:hypothetical protein
MKQRPFTIHTQTLAACLLFVLASFLVQWGSRRPMLLCGQMFRSIVIALTLASASAFMAPSAATRGCELSFQRLSPAHLKDVCSSRLFLLFGPLSLFCARPAERELTQHHFSEPEY